VWYLIVCIANFNICQVMMDYEFIDKAICEQNRSAIVQQNPQVSLGDE